MGRGLIDAAVRGGARGLVVAGVGNGNLGSSALAAAAVAARAGLAVVRSTRTGGGIVERNIEVDDDRLGFIAADELNPQKARILLMLGLMKTRDRTRFRKCSTPIEGRPLTGIPVACAFPFRRAAARSPAQ